MLLQLYIGPIIEGKVYSKKSVDSALRIAEQELGFEPVYHSRAACDQFSDHMELKRDRYIDEWGEVPPANAPRLLYTDEEIKWVRNEKILSQLDYLYFSNNYAKILGPDDEVIHYTPNIAQLVVNDARADLEDRGWAIMMMWLKGRQCGITTDSQVCIGHRTFFYDNIIALTGSSDKERSKDMVDKYKQLYDWIPYWLKPEMTRDRMGTRMEFGALNSKLIVQHGAQKYDIGRGNTPSAVHLSEVATYLNAEDLIDAGLVPAVHESPRKLVILESTGEGPYGWWYKTWIHCKKFYWRGEAKFRPGFIPWFVASDLYPTPTWLKRKFRLELPLENPKAIREAAREAIRREGWRPEGVTFAHAERAKKYIRTNDLLRKYYPENWEMPAEQMYFWQVMREEYKAKKILARFLREFAGDDLESFTASGESVFEVDTINDYSNSCQEPVGVFGFRAPLHIIPARLQADEHDRDTTRRIIKVGPYELVPLRWTGWQTADPTGKLLVFEWPEAGEDYYFGVDTSDGIGQDNTVLEGYRKGNLIRRGGQFLEYASAYVNANDFAAICHCVGLFYQGASARQPKFVIETGLNGEVTQLELRKMGWSNFHSWVRYDRKKMDAKQATRIGFVTNRWSRPMVIDYLVKALRDADIDINSPEFVREMQALHRDEDMQSARAEQGQHDDRFMALGIAFLDAHILELTGRAKSVSYLRQQRESEPSPMYVERLAGDELSLPAAETPALAAASTSMKQFFGNLAGAAYHPGATEDYGGTEL